MSSYQRLPCNVTHKSETRIDTNMTKIKIQKERDSSVVEQEQKNFQLEGPLDQAKLDQMVEEVVRRVKKSSNTEDRASDENNESIIH